MNLVDLQEKLIAAAKTEVLDDRVPYAFEKRVTALLASRVSAGNLNLWVRGLWRAAVSCVAITMLMGVWAFFSSVSASKASDDLSQNFETTLLASIDQNEQAQ
ncbi:MAG TPA: hypothetical protein VHG71_13015 [Verrucomicrobiae bacterium]|nr:hypothetical protein [Verrucomicrobiae bacterium]